MAIILEKSGDTHRINLEKPTAGKPFAGEIVINLDWSKGGSKISLAMPLIWI